MLGQQWEYLDYKDRLARPDSLRAQLQLEEREEKRQCLVLNVAAALLLWPPRGMTHRGPAYLAHSHIEN